jgi:hypothetical protein
MTKRARVRYLVAAACRKNAAGTTARNDAVKKVSHAYLISDDITGDSILRGRVLFYPGAKYN